MTAKELQGKGLAIRMTFMEGSKRYLVFDLSKPDRPVMACGDTEDEAWAKAINRYLEGVEMGYSFAVDDVLTIWRRWLPRIKPPDGEWLEYLAANGDLASITGACQATARKQKMKRFASDEDAQKYMWGCLRNAKEQRAAKEVTI